jgi:hypothetical protein
MRIPAGAFTLRPAASPAGALSVLRTPQIASLIVFLGEGRRGDDHARGAEPALEAGGIDEALLHRMRVLGCAEARDGRDVGALEPVRGVDAGVDRFALEQHGARATVAGVATLFDLEVVEVAQQRPQHLAGLGTRFHALAVDLESHALNSSRSSSANSTAIARRQSAAP